MEMENALEADKAVGVVTLRVEAGDCLDLRQAAEGDAAAGVSRHGVDEG